MVSESRALASASVPAFAAEKPLSSATSVRASPRLGVVVDDGARRERPAVRFIGAPGRHADFDARRTGQELSPWDSAICRRMSTHSP